MSRAALLVHERVQRLRDRIVAAGGDPARVGVVAVTKGFSVDAVEAALGAGLHQVGENYAQELTQKAAALAARPKSPPLVVPEWHFIGRLQSNKVKLVSGLVGCWQSVDRVSLVDEIGRRDPGARIMIQVNASGEPQKGGARISEVAMLHGRARNVGLDVVGLMSVGVHDDERATRDAFERTAALADDLGLVERSMGMSADLEAAVAAGTTMVRVGTALFGDRPGSHPRHTAPVMRD